jgi:uncharacterized protein
MLPELDWAAIEQSLQKSGYAKIGQILTATRCGELIDLYADDSRFRSRVNMAQYRFGEGEYKYFANPLPPIVQALREQMFPRLSPIANKWAEQLVRRERFPSDLDDYLKLCARQGQTRPTPLLLRYNAGGYNCLHQDLYGPLAFPLQITIALSRRNADYSGGEFLLVEQRPRAQSRGFSITLEQGEAIVFAVRERPVQGTRGFYRTVMRHGVSPLESGTRFALGVIFHDAK